MMCGSALMAVGGAFLTLSAFNAFFFNMINGRGWICIALVVFGAWRPGKAVLGAILFFGASVRGLGLALALFLTAFAAALASSENTPARAGLIALALTVFCVAIFSYGLGVPVPLLGAWAR